MTKNTKHILTLILFLIIYSCKKGKGAICNDGSRSYSVGQGTCSWHGGVDYYVNPNEIDEISTFLLFVFIAIVFWLTYHFLKDVYEKNSKTKTSENRNQNIVEHTLKKRAEQKEKQEKHILRQQEIFQEIQVIAQYSQIEIKYENKKFNATLKTQIYDEKLKNLISQLEIQRVMINPLLKGTILNLPQCIDLFPFAIELSIGSYFGHNDYQFKITGDLFLPMLEELSITSLSDKKFNLLIQGASNLKKLHFWKTEVRDFQIEDLESLQKVSISDSIGIPKLGNLPALEILVIREGKYRKNDFDKIQVYNLKRLIIFNVKMRNIPDNFEKFDDLQLEILD